MWKIAIYSNIGSHHNIIVSIYWSCMMEIEENFTNLLVIDCHYHCICNCKCSQVGNSQYHCYKSNRLHIKKLNIFNRIRLQKIAIENELLYALFCCCWYNTRYFISKIYIYNPLSISLPPRAKQKENVSLGGNLNT